MRTGPAPAAGWFRGPDRSIVVQEFPSSMNHPRSRQADDERDNHHLPASRLRIDDGLTPADAGARIVQRETQADEPENDRNREQDLSEDRHPRRSTPWP